jgi:hypothetical protein
MVKERRKRARKKERGSEISKSINQRKTSELDSTCIISKKQRARRKEAKETNEQEKEKESYIGTKSSFISSEILGRSVVGRNIAVLRSIEEWKRAKG